MMPPPLWIAQQPTPHLPSRITPDHENSDPQSTVIALAITGTFAISVIFLVAYKQYQQYRYQQKVKSLEKLWQQPPHKHLH